jgi:predicted nucleic acid-binding protein
MGVLLDSSVFIAKEREGKSARQSLTELFEQFAGDELAISIVTVVELAHGIARANTPQRQRDRQDYLNQVMTALQVQTITIPIAIRAGQIDGENTAKGIRLALGDLLIGVTALELGYRIATSNVRHFQRIPGLTVIPV